MHCIHMMCLIMNQPVFLWKPVSKMWSNTSQYPVLWCNPSIQNPARQLPKSQKSFIIMCFTSYLPAQFKYTFHLWVAQMFHNFFTVTKPSCSQHCPINCICLILIRSKRCMPDISISLSSQMFSD